MIVILKCAIFFHFKPNLIHWIASNTNLMKAPNTYFTKFVKNWFAQIKFFQILPKCHYYKSKYHQIHPGTPKYWDFGSFFSICKHQMSLLDQTNWAEILTRHRKSNFWQLLPLKFFWFKASFHWNNQNLVRSQKKNQFFKQKWVKNQKIPIFEDGF